VDAFGRPHKTEFWKMFFKKLRQKASSKYEEGRHSESPHKERERKLQENSRVRTLAEPF
jgi:hypothetical protein